jgi:nucleoside-diphosphate-sugar epimerase
MSPSVAVVGGLGSIGRHVVDYIVSNNLVQDVCVVDRTIPQIAALSHQHTTLFRNISFRQCSLNRLVDLDKALARDNSDPWDVIICCSREERFGLSEQAYESGTVQPALLTAEYAKLHGSLFVYVSDGCRRLPTESGFITEDSTAPKLRSGHKFNSFFKAEEALLAMDGLRLVILRTAQLYGPDIHMGFLQTLASATVFKSLEEPLVFGFSPQIRMHMVHVRDVARACWHIVEHVHTHDVTYPLLYNLVDDGNTRMQTFAHIVEECIQVRVVWMNTIMNKLLRFILKVPGMLDSFNSKILGEWLHLLEKNYIKNTPVDIYLFPEMVDMDEVAMDNTKLKEDTGFTYQEPEMTVERVNEWLDGLRTQGIFPAL